MAGSDFQQLMLTANRDTIVRRVLESWDGIHGVKLTLVISMEFYSNSQEEIIIAVIKSDMLCYNIKIKQFQKHKKIKHKTS